MGCGGPTFGLPSSPSTGLPSLSFSGWPGWSKEESNLTPSAAR